MIIKGIFAFKVNGNTYMMAWKLTHLKSVRYSRILTQYKYAKEKKAVPWEGNGYRKSETCLLYRKILKNFS
ncbi:MAG: hypothetical protein CO098_07640 [Bacteroidetes bacterium CG_4_9_14_3_um_filter_41_19]|nr:MAG: hypothetical protein CO098_07640 [Bacteroidetes bacterium CG_4_9_14_3_um_filter_41_19]